MKKVNPKENRKQKRNEEMKKGKKEINAGKYLERDNLGEQTEIERNWR